MYLEACLCNMNECLIKITWQQPSIHTQSAYCPILLWCVLFNPSTAFLYHFLHVPLNNTLSPTLFTITDKDYNNNNLGDWVEDEGFASSSSIEEGESTAEIVRRKRAQRQSKRAGVTSASTTSIDSTMTATMVSETWETWVTAAPLERLLWIVSFAWTIYHVDHLMFSSEALTGMSRVGIGYILGVNLNIYIYIYSMDGTPCAGINSIPYSCTCSQCAQQVRYQQDLY